MTLLSLKPLGRVSKSLWLLAVFCGPTFAETVTAPPVVIPAKRAEPQDRKDGAGMAAGLAAMGAAVAGLSCLELYRQAREIEAVDPAQAAQLRSMAAMQCSQAAQSAADAAKNQDSKERLSLNDTPTGVNPEPSTPERAQESPTAFQPPAPFEREATREIADISDVNEPEPAIFEQKLAESSLGIAPNVQSRGDSLTKLNPIEPSILGVNETNGSGQAATTPGLAGNFGFPVGNGSPQRALNGEIKEPEGLLRKKMRASESASEGSASENPASENAGEESNASSVLARLLGGGAEGAEALLGGQVADIDLPQTGNTHRSANIFEYASYRMKKSRMEGEIKIGKSKLAANALHRNTTAVNP